MPGRYFKFHRNKAYIRAFWRYKTTRYWQQQESVLLSFGQRVYLLTIDTVSVCQKIFSLIRRNWGLIKRIMSFICDDNIFEKSGQAELEKQHWKERKRRLLHYTGYHLQKRYCMKAILSRNNLHTILYKIDNFSQ